VHATPERIEATGEGASLDAFEDVAAAVEAGAGLPAVARAAGRALNASVAVVDASSSVLAVACASPDDEHAVLSGTQGSEALELRVADTVVGELRFRARGQTPPPALLRIVGTLIALDVERSRAPARATDAAIASFLADVLNRRVTDRENIVARSNELGTDLSRGAGVIVVRAHAQHPEEGDWRARVLTLADRGARAIARTALTAQVTLDAGRLGAAAAPERSSGADGELLVVMPDADLDLIGRAASSTRSELEAGLPGHGFVLGTSRRVTDPVDLHRAAAEALLAANVAEAQGTPMLAFDQTGSYRLLLPALSDDPAELRSFHDETVAPLIAYDEQYETDLLRTLGTYLEADGSVASAAQRLFTHRHTIRYRLERVRELTGLNVSSSEGRERLSLGLKAMHVLGIAPARGPATEPGAEGGRVRKEEPDR